MRIFEGTAKEQQMNTTIAVRLPDEVVLWVERKAAALGVTRSVVVRSVLAKAAESSLAQQDEEPSGG